MATPCRASSLKIGVVEDRRLCALAAAYLTAAHLKPDSAHTISHIDLASRLDSPETKAIFTWNYNIAVSSPEQRRLRRALERDDLLQVTLGRWTANGAANNVNALNPGKKAELAESCAVHSINVSVAPA